MYKLTQILLYYMPHQRLYLTFTKKFSMTAFVRIIFYLIASVLFIVSVYEILDNEPLINTNLITNLSYLLLFVYVVLFSKKISTIVLFNLNKKHYTFIAPVSGKILKWQHTFALISILTAVIFSLVFYKANHWLAAFVFVFVCVEKTLFLVFSVTSALSVIAINDNCILIQNNKIKTVYFNAIKNIELKYDEWFFILKDGKVVTIRKDITSVPYYEKMRLLLQQKLAERGIRLP